MKRRLIIIAGVCALGVVWYLFRPERLFINKTVNESAAEAATISAAVAKGAFHGVHHDTHGTATVFRAATGQRTVRFTDFMTSNGPDVRVYLVAAPDAMDNATVTTAGFVDLGAMKGNVGNQNYDVPDSIDLSKYRAVTIWCRRFGVNFATAPLTAN
jgi:hypothetical protein